LIHQNSIFEDRLEYDVFCSEIVISSEDIIPARYSRFRAMKPGPLPVHRTTDRMFSPAKRHYFHYSSHYFHYSSHYFHYSSHYFHYSSHYFHYSSHYFHPKPERRGRRDATRSSLRYHAAIHSHPISVSSKPFLTPPLPY